MRDRAIAGTKKHTLSLAIHGWWSVCRVRLSRRFPLLSRREVPSESLKGKRRRHLSATLDWECQWLSDRKAVCFPAAAVSERQDVVPKSKKSPVAAKWVSPRQVRDGGGYMAEFIDRLTPASFTAPLTVPSCEPARRSGLSSLHVQQRIWICAISLMPHYTVEDQRKSEKNTIKRLTASCVPCYHAYHRPLNARTAVKSYQNKIQQSISYTS